MLIKVHVEGEIVCFEMHQGRNVKKGNMGIGKSFFESMIYEGNMGHFKPFENDPYYQVWCVRVFALVTCVFGMYVCFYGVCLYCVVYVCVCVCMCVCMVCV